MAITLSGPSAIAESAPSTPYKVSLVDIGLPVGDSLTFTLDTEGITATEGFVFGEAFPRGIDFSGLLNSDISAGSGLGLAVTPAGGGALSVTVSNTSEELITAGAELVSFAIRTGADFIAELGESFRVSLASATEPVAPTGTMVTTIVNLAGVIEQSTNPVRWLALNGDRLTYEGIAGTELRAITVETGDQPNDVVLADAVAFATLDTGAGDDRVSALVEPISDDLVSTRDDFASSCSLAMRPTRPTSARAQAMTLSTCSQPQMWNWSGHLPRARRATICPTTINPS